MNFVQKSPRVMSISPCSGARGLERSIWLKYNIVLKRENTITLGLNAAKNTHHIHKSIKQKLFGIECCTKQSLSAPGQSPFVFGQCVPTISVIR